ncbi:MAG: hypothetical protein ABIN66_08905 [candidate division WOR-3 bacterium]
MRHLRGSWHSDNPFVRRSGILKHCAFFISPYDIGIKIYKSDGRLAYSGELHEGENRISLEPGVYIWTTRNPQPVTRNQSGKLAIR